MKPQVAKAISDFKPILREGRIRPQGSFLIYETDNPVDHITVPAELADILTLCNGNYSIREIIEKIYKRHKTVHFKSTLQLIMMLRDRGFLMNSDEIHLPNSSSINRSQMAQFKLPLISTLKSAKWSFSINPNWILFYILSMGIGLGFIFAIRQFLGLSSEANPSATWSLSLAQAVRLFTESSVILLGSSALTALSRLLLTGRIYSLGLNFSILGLSLNFDETPLWQIENRLFRVLYQLSRILAPLAILGPLSIFSPQLNESMELWIIACTWTFYFMTPFLSSPLYYLAKNLRGQESLFMDDESSTGTKTLPWVLYRCLWTYAAIFSLWIFFEKIGPLKALESGVENLILSLSLWSALAWIFLKPVGHTLLFQEILPLISRIKTRWGLYKQFKKIEWTNQDLLHRLQELPLFSYFPDSFLLQIIKESDLRQYPKRGEIIREGEVAKELFVLLEGEVEVVKHTGGSRQRLTSLKPITIFGEMAILEGGIRSADVITQHGARVFVIPVKVIQDCAEKSQSLREIEAFQNALMVAQFFSSAPAFRDLPQEAVDLLTMKSKLEFLPAGHRVFSKGISVSPFT